LTAVDASAAFWMILNPTLASVSVAVVLIAKPTAYSENVGTGLDQ
jgi:hypothetical protein